MIKIFVGILIVAFAWGSLPPQEDNILHIGGIFPIGGEGGWQGGQVSIDFPFLFLCLP